MIPQQKNFFLLIYNFLLNTLCKQRSSSRNKQHEINEASHSFSQDASVIGGLNKEQNRLLTFTNWQHQTMDKALLAMIGFYSIGPNDLVKCHFCNVEIGMWQPEDNPVEEHLKWSPNCPLLHGKETANEPINAKALKRILPKITYDTCGIRANNVSSQSSRNRSYAEVSVNRPTALNIRDLRPQPNINHSQEIYIK